MDSFIFSPTLDEIKLLTEACRKNRHLSLIYKLCSKLNFNKIELQMELDINNVEFYAYFVT